MMDAASTPASTPAYALGRSEREYHRLMAQSRLMRPWTERYLRAAGLRPGAAVLDLGSGVGDVSLLAAEIVGPSGSVLGIDRDASAVEMARERAENERLSASVRFDVAGLEDFSTHRRFDAVIGRFVLMYQPDPVPILRQAADLLRPGGVLGFHEMDMTNREVSWPPCRVFDDSFELFASAFVATGAHADMGRRLTRSFLDAGLAQPTVEVHTPIATGPESPVLDWLARTLQSLEPAITSAGLSLPPGIDFGNLLETWQKTITAERAQFLGTTQYGAWTRVP